MKSPRETIYIIEGDFSVVELEVNTKHWEVVSGEDAMQQRVSELNASGFDTPENDIVVGEITEDTE